jgi:hypothetical protein
MPSDLNPAVHELEVIATARPTYEELGSTVAALRQKGLQSQCSLTSVPGRFPVTTPVANCNLMTDYKPL